MDVDNNLQYLVGICAGGHEKATLSYLQRNTKENLKLLLNSPLKQSINHKEFASSTLLHYMCACKGRDPIVRLLIQYGADVNKANDKKYTPIVYIVFHSNKELTKLLLDNGANPRDGIPFVQPGHDDIKELLDQYIANPVKGPPTNEILDLTKEKEPTVPNVPTVYGYKIIVIGDKAISATAQGSVEGAPLDLWDRRQHFGFREDNTILSKVYPHTVLQVQDATPQVSLGNIPGGESQKWIITPDMFLQSKLNNQYLGFCEAAGTKLSLLSKDKTNCISIQGAPLDVKVTIKNEADKVSVYQANSAGSKYLIVTLEMGETTLSTSYGAKLLFESDSPLIPQDFIAAEGSTVEIRYSSTIKHEASLRNNTTDEITVYKYTQKWVLPVNAIENFNFEKGTQLLAISKTHTEVFPAEFRVTKSENVIYRGKEISMFDVTIFNFTGADIVVKNESSGKQYKINKGGNVTKRLPMDTLLTVSTGENINVAPTLKRITQSETIGYTSHLNLRETEMYAIEDWLPGKGFLRIYKASQDGFALSAFQICAGKGPCLAIISTQKDEHSAEYRFGGYAAEGWSLNGKNSTNPGTFVFSLKNPQNAAPSKYDIVRTSAGSRAYYTDISTHHIRFGRNDICVFNQGRNVEFEHGGIESMLASPEPTNTYYTGEISNKILDIVVYQVL